MRWFQAICIILDASLGMVLSYFKAYPSLRMNSPPLVVDKLMKLYVNKVHQDLTIFFTWEMNSVCYSPPRCQAHTQSHAGWRSAHNCSRPQLCRRPTDRFWIRLGRRAAWSTVLPLSPRHALGLLLWAVSLGLLKISLRQL